MSASRVLVAIANHGDKNRRFLDQLLATYRGMRHDVDVVVLSDRPKDLGADVEVRVGAPTDDPWSLPFAHRSLFAERVGDYDLFIYTEDDTAITEAHVDAFLEVDALLPDDEVPGFLRYEIRDDGRRSYCSIHSAYHWRPDSVTVHGGEVFADYSNQHSACYLLTRAQLERAIVSGGFLVAPHAGAYDMLVSAATDPYTRCGMRRRLCVSRMDDFLLHHLPNVYLDRLGIDEPELRAQLDAIGRIATGELGAGELLDTTSALPTPAWDVLRHPRPTPELRAVTPTDAASVLSVGCAGGLLERDLFGVDADITAIPLDEVTAQVADRLHDITTTAPDLDAALVELGDRTFDVVVVHDVLHHVVDPVALLRRLAARRSATGRLVVSVPNFAYQRLRARAGMADAPLPVSGFAGDGVHATDPRRLRRWARRAGLEVVDQRVEVGDRVRRLTSRPPPLVATWLGPRFHVALSERR